MGQYVRSSGIESAAYRTGTKITSISLSKGVWVVVAYLNFAGSFEEAYQVNLGGLTYRQATAHNGGGVSAVRVMNISTDTTVELEVWHNNASNQTARGEINAVRIA